MAFSIKLKNLDRVKANVKNTMENALKDVTLRKEIGKQARDTMVALSKTGKDPSNGRFFKALKKSTVKRRRELADLGNTTTDVYSPEKSNLSFTGQLLNSVKVIVKAGDSIITIKATGGREAYKTGKASTAKNTPSNEKLMEIHMGGKGVPARRFLGMSKKALGSSKRKVIEFLRRKLRRAGL